MKIILKLLFPVILINILLSSCNNQQNVFDETYLVKPFTLNDIPKTKLLVGSKLIINDITFPRRLAVVDNYLVVSELDSDLFLHLIKLDASSPTYLRNFGVKGDGPGEIRGVSYIETGFEENTFWTFFVNNKLNSKFQINDTSLHAIDQFRLVGDLYMAVDITWTADSTFMTIRADDHEKFVEYDLEGNIIKTFGTWQGIIAGNYPMSIISSLYDGRFKSSPDKQTFALFCIRTDVIEILDRRSGNILSVRGPANYRYEFEVDYSLGYPMFSTKNFKDSKPQYVDGYLTDKYIYALYSGRTRAEIDQKNIMCDEVFVFDYEGNLLKHYKLDHSLLTFAIDEKHNKMYGGTYDANPGIVVFDLD